MLIKKNNLYWRGLQLEILRFCIGVLLWPAISATEAATLCLLLALVYSPAARRDCSAAPADGLGLEPNILRFGRHCLMLASALPMLPAALLCADARLNSGGRMTRCENSLPYNSIVLSRLFWFAASETEVVFFSSLVVCWQGYHRCFL